MTKESRKLVTTKVTVVIKGSHDGRRAVSAIRRWISEQNKAWDGIDIATWSIERTPALPSDVRK